MNSVNLNQIKSNTNLPSMEWNIGDRVVIRRREKDGFYDSIGYLLEKTVDFLTLETRKGTVTIPANKMVYGKKVPPPPCL